MGVPAASRGYFGSTRPRASSVANSSSSTSLSTRSRILACNADLGIARIWKASAIESSGGTPLGEESINAVPARFARSRFVVSGTTGIDWRTRVSVSLCQITTGRRPVYSRGRYAPRPAHQSSPRFHSAPLFRARWPTPPDPARQGQGLPHCRPSQAWANPSGQQQGAEPRSSSHFHRVGGPAGPQAGVRHSRNGLPPIARPQSYHARARR